LSRVSVELEYLRKKARYFQRWQIVGLAMILSGFVIVVSTNFFVPVLALLSAEHLNLMMTGSMIVFLGILIALYYSRKLSQFITQWSRVVEELEKRVREMED